jgi:hypothetical protein
MSIKARIIKLESAPPRDNSLSNRIAGARANCAHYGIHLKSVPLTDREEQQIRGRGLAEKLKFYRMRGRI